MSFENQTPTEFDVKQYQEQKASVRQSPFFSKPETFLKLGQRVRAKVRVWDTPDDDMAKWGRLHAEKGDTGTVVHVQKGCWPTVTFDRSGTSTCVTDFEVEPVDTEKQRMALVHFFDGLTYKLRDPDEDIIENPSSAFAGGFHAAESYLQDIESGRLPGLSLEEMVSAHLRSLTY